ncbi:MAG: OB-fold nucleic acid binding domain-containing protein, partial [Pseudomonadota bacterium]
VAARTEGGPFRDVFDLARRVDLKRVGKRPVEMLARSGALDQLDNNRRKMLESVDQLVAYSAAAHEDKASSQISMFGDGGADLPSPRLPEPEDWLPTERLGQEHQAVGFYLSGHPLDDYQGPLKRQRVLTLAELTEKARIGPQAAKIAGSVASRQERKSARGNRFAFVQLSDPTGLYEVTVFSDTLETYRDHLEAGANVVLSVEATLEGDQLKLLARGVQPIDDAVAGADPTGLKIYVSDPSAVASVATRLMEAAKGAARGGPVNLVLMHPELPGEVEIPLPSKYPITPQIKGAIKHVAGVAHVEDF